MGAQSADDSQSQTVRQYDMIVTDPHRGIGGEENLSLHLTLDWVSDLLVEINERGRPSSVDALRRNCGCKTAERQEGSCRRQEIVRRGLQRMT